MIHLLNEDTPKIDGLKFQKTFLKNYCQVFPMPKLPDKQRLFPCSQTYQIDQHLETQTAKTTKSGQIKRLLETNTKMGAWVDI